MLFTNFKGHLWNSARLVNVFATLTYFMYLFRICLKLVACGKCNVLTDEKVFTCCLRTKPEPSLTASHSPPHPRPTLYSPPHPVTVQPELLPWQRSWPSAWPSPLTPGGLTFGLRIIRGEGGVGQLSLEDNKSTSLIGYHSPFPYPHLCNWRIDQLDLLYIVSSNVSSLRRTKCNVGGCWNEMVTLSGPSPWCMFVRGPTLLPPQLIRISWWRSFQVKCGNAAI